MGMNEVLRRLTDFERKLELLQQRVRESMTDIDSRHQEVRPQWDAKDDQMKLQYLSRYDPLHENMTKFLKQVEPEFLERLSGKISEIKFYLNGH